VQIPDELAKELLEVLQWYAFENHIVTLRRPKDGWVVARERLTSVGFGHMCESYNGDETYVETGSKAYSVMLKLQELTDE
jgi:hypothetical protein